MRTRMTWLVVWLVLGCSGLAALSLTQAQDRPVPSFSLPVAPATGNTPRPPARPEAEPPARDLSKLPPLLQQMYFSAQRGADWLHRSNRPDGRFAYGYLPALKMPLEGDHYLRQLGTAFALARAARFTKDERYTAVARQAVLRLLLDTAVDPSDPQVRATTLPSLVVNRLAAAGLLVLAIHELPAPGDDLLEQAEQLCHFIRKQQRSDGSLSYADHAEDPKAASVDPEGINYYPG